MSKTEKRVHQSEYVNNEWYYAQLADDWYIADWRDEYLIMRKMSENGYGDITPQQASLMKYATIYELNKNQLKTLLGKRYDEAVFKDWDDVRQKPLREYKEWLSRRA
jgi:hypothetical protein